MDDGINVYKSVFTIYLNKPSAISDYNDGVAFVKRYMIQSSLEYKHLKDKGVEERYKLNKLQTEQ